jgi:glycerol-3-phosphate acyltransferase PlsY
MTLAIGCLLAWLLGGIPFGLVLVRVFKGVDIRTIGSGNIGATNASRAFGGGARPAVFALIYALDFAKGLGPALAGAGPIGGTAASAVLLGGCAVVGHCASPYLRLRGGKGVATATGVVAALDWRALLVGLAVFALVRLATGQVFLGSLALGIALAAAMALLDPAAALDARLPQTLFCAALALFFFWTHRSNLRRMLARKETA